jgi:hypothetical protein
VAIIHKLGDPEQQELIHGEWVFTNCQSAGKNLLSAHTLPACKTKI